MLEIFDSAEYLMKQLAKMQETSQEFKKSPLEKSMTAFSSLKLGHLSNELGFRPFTAQEISVSRSENRRTTIQ